MSATITFDRDGLLRFLFNYETDVQQGGDIKAFVDRILEQESPEQNLFDVCDICCQKTALTDGRFYQSSGDDEVFICKWCKEREDNHE